MAARPSVTETHGSDQFDDLFDYGVDTEIPDLDVNLDVPAQNNSSKRVNLGVDEEIIIAKQKRPTIRLDAERLLSQQGLPKLRRTAPEQLGKRLKGKGHEYTDAARILNFYQLWADDLYRKANFRDTISIIEKLGHTKRVQIARNQYLDDLLPKNIPSEIEAEIERQGKEKQTEKAKEQDNDDDLYEPAPQGASRRMQEDNGGSLFLGGANDDSGDDDVFGAHPNDTELDALMRQEASVDIPVTLTAATKEKEKSKTVEDEFGDGFEAIDDWDEIMDGAASQVQSKVSSGNTSGATTSIFDGATVAENANDSSMIPPDDIGDDDEDALEAMYGF